MNLPANVYLVEGTQPGPNVLVMGGTHGDELPGVEIIHRLWKLFGLSEENPRVQRPDWKGNLYLAIGNPAAVAINHRTAAEDKARQDLNRCFVPVLMDDPTNDWPDMRRARALRPVLRQIDVMLDLHATTSPTQPFVCFGSYDGTRDTLLDGFPVARVITDPDFVLPRDKPPAGVADKDITPGTTDYMVDYHGGTSWNEQLLGTRRGISIVYESGMKTDLSTVDREMTVVARFLVNSGLATEDQVAELGLILGAQQSRERLVCKLVRCVKQRDGRRGFTFDPAVRESWMEIKKGQRLGAYPDGVEEVAPADGILMFPKDDKKLEEKPSEIYYLAERVN